MAHYETSGLWKGELIGGPRLERYTSPQGWTGGLTPDTHEGESVYLEYEPTCAVFDLGTGSLSEYSLGEDPIKNGAVPGAEFPLLNRMGVDAGGWQEFVKRMAGYESAEGLHKVFLHYRTFDESTFSDFAKTFLLSPTGTVLATNTELSVPGLFALWAGSLVATDGGNLYQL